MNSIARVVTATLSAIPFAVLAAGGPPPAEVDLGAMKLKRANAPATTATTAPTGTPATTTLPAVQRTNILPGGTTQATPAAAAAPAAPAAPQGTANNTAQTGIGNVVQTPLKNRATDILQTNNKPEEKAAQSNNDLQVKMPSLFRRP
jgi:hypothetical protein